MSTKDANELFCLFMTVCCCLIGAGMFLVLFGVIAYFTYGLGVIMPVAITTILWCKGYRI